jgi:hypothetical protein
MLQMMDAARNLVEVAIRLSLGLDTKGYPIPSFNCFQMPDLA